MSSTFTPAETLSLHRPLLLAMEAIGWFHMAGKARAEFLRHHGGEDNGYDERCWHTLETPPFPWDDLLGWVKQRFSGGNLKDAWPESFVLFTEKHGGRGAQDRGLLGLLQAGHAMASGIEKQSYPDHTIRYLNQTIPHMWLSSPWGHPKRNLLADSPEILTPHGWRQLVAEIRRVLEELKDLGTKHVQDVALWHRWREQAIGPDSFIRRAFLATLAETRLPNNDVTLWDQSYVAAALFKSAVAGALLDSSFPWRTDGSIKQKTRWRLLTVAIGTEHYEARAVKIGDWTGAQGAIEGFFRRVAQLVEVDLAVGSLLYRDDSVAVFSFPGERFDEEEQERQKPNRQNFKFDDKNFASWLDDWKNWLQNQVEAIAHDLNLETPPFVRLSGPTRSLVPLVKERREALRRTAVPVHKAWNVNWTVPAESKGHVCPVCRVRLNGDPTNKGTPCQVCWERRHHRRDDWLQGHLGNDTIWFEEVADANGRLALLTFQLDVEPWLNGERVDSLRAQAIPEWRRFNPVLFGQLKPIDLQRPFEWLRSYITDKLHSYDKNDPVLKSLHEGYQHENKWEDFYKKIVEDRADAPEWDIQNDDQRAAWLAHQLFRKLPSPGRVYRFWREAEEFFTDLLREFRQIAARSDNPWRVRRLLLIPEDKSGWQDLTLYDGRWQGRQISLVYVESLGGVVTASNLSRLLRPEQPKETLKEEGEAILLEEEDRFGHRVEMKVKDVRELDAPYAHLSIYAPVIPLALSPLRFRVIVSLEVASECVDLAIQWWQKRFAGVWDRLPLRVGVIAFPRLVPYQAVVEAVRNVEDELAASEKTWQVQEKKTWWVQEVERRDGVVALRLRRPDGRETLRIIPVRMPDGREDVFYPYVAVEDRSLRFPRDFRHPEGQVYRHVADLRFGDGLRVTPARVATLFLESTDQRFERLDVHYLEDWTWMREVWVLLQRVAPSQTAVQRLRGELARLERDWQSTDGRLAAPPDVWRDTLRAMLAHHLEVQGAALDALTEAAVDVLLQWALDWHITALKESV
ncbi:MAG: CRISPR-associated protein Csx11 [Actinomycetota bacterium]|nr:CRISPR-associated protein Csx11 [Actinomycetota bacterium]